MVGELDRVRRVVRVAGFINSAPGFEEQPKAIKGASDLLVEIFGEKGRHPTLAMGTNKLPPGVARGDRDDRGDSIIIRFLKSLI